MDERWVAAIGFVVGGVLVGALAAWLVRRWLTRSTRHEAAGEVAGIAAAFTFWFAALLGILLALAQVRPETLEDLPRRIVDYTPRLLVAGIILIGGYALATLISGLAGIGLERTSGRMVRRIAALIRWTIFGAIVILALAQLGVDTTILVLLTGVAGFAVALATALLIGLGGRRVAGEIAAGRYLGRILERDMRIEAGQEQGRVLAFHAATLELELEDGRRRHVPYSAILAAGATVVSAPTPEGRAAGDEQTRPVAEG